MGGTEGGRRGEERVRVFTEPLLMGNYSYCSVPAAYSYFRKKLTTRGSSSTSQAEFCCHLLRQFVYVVSSGQ